MHSQDDYGRRDLTREPFKQAELQAAHAYVTGLLGQTPQISWPLLSARLGAEVWVKHENHLPTGAFKVRGGLWFVHQLQTHRVAADGIIAATRGNHGQSVAYAASGANLAVVIVVPRGNNPDKNRAMEALGAELIEHGRDFDQALDYAQRLAGERNLLAMPSFHPWLVQGVGSYALELFEAVADLDAVYVPIGLGSGICGVISARNALGLKTEIIGVVSSHADGYAQSFEQGRVIETAQANTLADGLAVRVPSAAALQQMTHNVSRVVRVSDAAVLEAIRIYFDDTHNVAEGAGAAPLAALIAEAPRYRGKRVGLILSGGNLARRELNRALVGGGWSQAGNAR